MNKEFFIAWLVAFVLWMLGSFVVHGLLLQAEYAKSPNLFRPEAESQAYFPLMILAHVIKSGALAWICARGVEAKPWMAQGVRFVVVGSSCIAASHRLRSRVLWHRPLCCVSRR